MTDYRMLIESIDRLNSHARAAGGGLLSSEKWAIYAYKDFVTSFLARKGLVKARLVKWTGKCGRCGGTGKWEGWYPDSVPQRCWHCDLGMVTLRFTETTLPGDVVWHHPWDGRDGHGRDIAWAALGSTGMSPCGRWEEFDSQKIEWHNAGDWAPLKAGLKLDVNLLIPFLLYVEGWLPTTETEPRDDRWWWLRKTALQMIHGYRLDLGTTSMRCQVCGGPPHHGAHGQSRIGHLPVFWSNDIGRVCGVHWSGYACAAHRDEAFKRDEIPAELINPIVQKWLDRRVKKEVAA